MKLRKLSISKLEEFTTSFTSKYLFLQPNLFVSNHTTLGYDMVSKINDNLITTLLPVNDSVHQASEKL